MLLQSIKLIKSLVCSIRYLPVGGYQVADCRVQVAGLYYNKDARSSSGDLGDRYPKGISNTVRAPVWPSFAIFPTALAYATKTDAVNSGLLSSVRLNSILCFDPFPVIPERNTVPPCGMAEWFASSSS